MRIKCLKEKYVCFLLLLFKAHIYANLFMGCTREYYNRPGQHYMYSLRLKPTPCIIYFRPLCVRYLDFQIDNERKFILIFKNLKTVIKLFNELIFTYCETLKNLFLFVIVIHCFNNFTLEVFLQKINVL